MYNKDYWLHGDFGAFRQFFFEQMCSEPHSSKQLEDFLDWSADTDPAVLADATSGRMGLDGAACPPLEDACRRVRCPVTVIHGTDDRIRPIGIGERLAELTGGCSSRPWDAGHALPAREPVLINRLIHDVGLGERRPAPAGPAPGGTEPAGGGDRQAQAATWVRSGRRPRRALFLSSPIGLGHARRDVAIAAELASAARTSRSTGWPSIR